MSVAPKETTYSREIEAMLNAKWDLDRVNVFFDRGKCFAAIDRHIDREQISFETNDGSFFVCHVMPCGPEHVWWSK